MFNKDKNKDLKIVFTNAKQYPDFAFPKPATKTVPDWYKFLDNKYPEDAILPHALQTAKACMPLFDAMTAGYIFTTPVDVWVDEKNGELIYYTALPNVIEFHPNSQIHTHPQSMHERVPKFINGITIKTPQGYSCLFVPPMHNPNPWFEIMPGIVDTDNYNSYINLPFILKNKSFRGLIPADTPMAQVIPFKRDTWTIETGDEEETHQAEMQNITLNSMWKNRYKRLFWSKKNWS